MCALGGCQASTRTPFLFSYEVARQDAPLADTQLMVEDIAVFSASRVRFAAADSAAPSTPARRSAEPEFATRGFPGNQRQRGFSVLKPDENRWKFTKQHRRNDDSRHQIDVWDNSDYHTDETVCWIFPAHLLHEQGQGIVIHFVASVRVCVGI